MYGTNHIISYSIAVFIIMLITGCILNLLKSHYIFQLTGIAFLFTYAVFKSIGFINAGYNISLQEFYGFMLPAASGISACLVSMALGFMIFPNVRRMFKD